MFKALMGSRSSSSTDVRSKSRRKTDNSDAKSTSSRKSSRGDDRDRGLGDLSSYSPSGPRSKRGPSSIAGDSIASSYVTAEPEAIDDSDRYIIERTPKRRDSDRDSKSSRRRERDRSISPDRERRRSRRATEDTLDDDLDRERERDRRERRRTQSGDPYVPPVSTGMPPSAPAVQFATDIAAPGFSQFPMQYDTGMPPTGHSPEHAVPYDPHVQQQFPGQFPEGVAQPYLPMNPAGAAADYYGDQGQSVEMQPGVRPAPPSVLPNTQAHLMAASPTANPPPEPSSMGQTGAAAAYFDDDFHVPAQPAKPSTATSSRPPKPSNPSKPSKPSSSNVLPAAAVGVATYGISGMMSHSHSEQHSSSEVHHSSSYNQPMAQSMNQPMTQPTASSSYKPTHKPPHSHSFSEGVGLAAAGGAAGYMMGHHHHSSSPEHASQYSFQNYEGSSQAGIPPYAPGYPNSSHNHNNALYAAGAAGYASNAAHNPGFYPHGPGALALQERQRGPLGRFVDFWRDPEAVGRFEDYTETIGVCKYCFQPGTSSLDAPRKHHYDRRRRHSADRYSSASSSRVSKLSRYQSSEDEGRRRNKSKKSSSWLPGMLAGYATKSLFSNKEFDDSYSIRSGRVASSHDEDDRRSYTSRGVTRRSGRSPQRDYQSDGKRPSGYSQRTRSRSRSSSRSGRHSFLKEAALGAAVGGAALAVTKSRNRSRSRSSGRGRRRKDSSSSSSFVNVSRPSKKSVAGGIGSFFTSSSENRKKGQSKKRSGFFSFKGGSSSSSLDNDLAFGDGFSKKSSKLKKKDKKGKDVDAALVGLGATATRLAGSSPNGPGRSVGQMYTKSRHSNYASSANDDEWIDESEDQSASSVSSALAFGASSADSSSDSSSRWGWRWGSKKDKKKKDKKSSTTNAALAIGAGALGAAAISSARHRDSEPPSSSGSLQQVYPMPTSDPSRFDVAKMSPSVSGGNPALIRPGPIPLQQPQPVTPVSQAVYTTQGGLPGSIPAYSAPAVPPAFAANGFGPHDTQLHDSRDVVWAPEVPQSEGRRPHRRSDSFPVFPTQETASGLKRRSTAKDQASVQFNLTEEQAERERRLDRRDRNSRDDFVDPQPLQLLDREVEDRQEAERLARRRREREEEDRLEAERLERRRKEREEEKRRDTTEREKESSSWVGVAAAGALGAAAASTVLSRKTDDDEASEASLRRNERREKRRAERRRDGDIDAESSLVSRFEPVQPIEEAPAVEHREEKKPRSPRRASPRQPQVYEDYAEFFAPEEIRHSPDDHKRSGSGGMPTIVEIEPASERRARDEPPREEPDYSHEPYENVDHLPWPVPRLNFIEPTPPQSISGGSVRDATSPIAPPVDTSSYDTKPRERSTTGSRVSWGDDKTHEYEIPSSSEQDPLEHDISPYEEVSPKDVPLPVSEISSTREIASKPEYGTDIEFAATIAAATAAAGFDPAMITDDPSYHTRTSPPGSEDEGRFNSSWATSARKEPHGFVEGEIGEVGPKTIKDMPSSKHITDKDELFFDEPESFSKNSDISSGRRDKSSIAQEVLEQLNGKRDKQDQPTSPERERERDVDIDAFSMPGGFDAADSRDLVDSRDERSVFSAPGPVTQNSESPTQSKKSKSKKKSRKSVDAFEIETKEREPEPEPERQSEPVPETVCEPEPEVIEVQDENRSIVSAPATKGETSKSRRSRRSGDDFDIAPLQDVTESRDDTRSVFSVPATKDETSKSRKSRRSGDDFDIYRSRDVPEPREPSPPVTAAPLPKEYESPRSKSSRRSGDDFEIVSTRDISESHDDRSVFSTPATKDETSKTRRSRRSGDDLDISRSRDASESRDDTRSVFSVPATKDETSKSRRSRRSGDDFDISRSRDPSETRSVTSESARHRRSRRSGDDYVSRSRDVSESRSVASESSRHRKSRRSGDDFDPPRDTETPSPEDGEDGEEKKKRRKRRSRHGSDTFSIDDDARSAITDLADDKSERRKHRHRSSRDSNFDDTASITSSPARISESRERRKGKDEEKEKKPGGFLRSIFGSQVSAPAERTHSSSLDKRSSREAMSEVGVDDERRRRKKRSSKHRSSSNGDEMEDTSDKEKDAEDGTNLEDYRSSRQRKEERRRHRYEEIVDSGRKRDSEKDLNDDYDNQSFLNERPETPAAAERDDDVRGASGLPASAAGTALGAAAGLGLGEILQQRPRSRSTSPPSAEKALDLTPKSQSRPASPETSRSPNARRGSVAKSITESPTAVPLHFRRPPTSPGLSRAVPVEAPNVESPGSPSQQRHRRPGSVEFRNSREIRPLWLVERHSSVKGETEPQEGLPSLPSSKTSSRVPSIEDLKALNDDDGVRSWEQVDLSHSIMENRRPTGLTIETDHANENHDREIDLLDSQQATPTAQHFENSSPAAKREKLKYEFHSPSELLRNPDNFEPLPGSPTLEALPSAEGSAVGSKDKEVEEKFAEQEARLEPETAIQEKESLHSGGDVAKGAGFAGIVDAAAIAAVKNKENEHPTEHAEDSEPRTLPEGETEASAAEPKIHGFGDIVDAAVATEIASHDKARADEEIGEPGTAIEEDAPVQLETAQPVEATRETTEEPIPEPTEQSAGPADTETAEETAMTPAQKRKAKKNKKKNKSQGQSVDLVSEETAPVVQGDASKEVEQAPVAETPVVQDAPAEVDTTSVEPEVVAPAQEDVPETAQLQTEAEPVEASREIVAEPEIPAEPEVSAPSVEEDATAQQPAEAEPVEASRDLGLDSSAAVTETSEPLTAPEPEAEPDVALTAAQKKKAKKDKKKKKNKTKDASAAEPADGIATSHPQDQVVASTETPKQEDAVLTGEGPVLPAEGSDKNIEEQEATEPVFTDANETAVPETTQPEGEEASRSLEDVDKPVEEATFLASEDLTAPTATEPTKEDSEGEDNFQEAVEEQVPQPIEEKEPEIAPEPTAELVSEPAAEPAAEIPADVPAEPPAELQETKAQKKKNKKKNRKSAAVEETSVPTEEEPTPAPEGETEEFKPEESASTEPADAQIPETSGEILPSDPEQPAKDLELPSETASEEPAAAPEQQQDVPPAESTVDVAPAPVEVEGPIEETSREIAEPAAVETQPEVQPETAAEPEPEPESQPQPEAEAEAEAEPEVALTAAQKKKAKKDKKKKNKQSQSSVPDEEQLAELAPTEPSSPAPEPEPVAEPTASPAVEDTAKEVSSVPEEVSAVVPPQDIEEVRIEPEQSVEPGQPTEPEQPTELEKVVEPEQPQEEAAPASIPEPAVEDTTAESPKEVPAVQEEQVQAEETPVEPEVPMTAAQRKKAKKAAKKKQEEEAALAAASDNASPAEHEPVAEAESTETPAQVEAAAVVEDTPVGIEQDAAPAADIEAPTAEETPLPEDAEVTESSKDLEPPTEDVPAVADAEPAEASAEVVPALEEAPVPTDVPQSEEPKPEDAISAPAEEATPAAVETETPQEPEAPAEPEVPMTAAEKKKAKKNKKKQQKQSESAPAEEAAPSVEETKATEEDTVPEPIQTEAAPEVETETKAQEEQTQDTPALDKEAPTEPVSDGTVAAPEPPKQATDVHDVAQESAPEAAAEPAAPVENPQEEQKADTALEQPSEAKSTDDKEPTAEETPIAESTEAASPEEAALTPAQKRKAKKDKKKNKGLSATLEEQQPAPAEEESKPTPEEEETVAAPTEEEPTPTPAEEPAEPTTEPPSTDKNVEPPVPTEEASPEEASPETLQQDAPADAAAAEAAEEAAMTPAQKRKAKKDKKKRQSLAAEELQATPAEEEPKSMPAEEAVAPTPPAEYTEPAPPQDVEQPANDKEIEPPTVVEEAKPEEPLPENTQNDAPPDEAAIEAAEEAAMTPAQKRKAKKDKKKRQSLAVEEQQPAAAEGEVKDTPVEEGSKGVSTEEATEANTAETTELASAQEIEQPTPEKDAEPPVVTEEAPRVGEPSPEESISQDAPADTAAAEAVEEAAMTPAQKRKAKKDKKKRQSLAAEEQQPAPSEELPTATEEETKVAPTEDVSVEPATSRDNEQPALAEDAEAPVATEEAPKPEEPSPEESAQQDFPTDTATPETVEEEAMTRAQKRKAKKDKEKNRKSVAWGDEETSSQADDSKPEQDSSVPEEKTESQAPSAEFAITSEDAAKELPDAEEVAEAATDKDVSVLETSASGEPEKTEEVALSEEAKEITEQGPSTPVPPEEEFKPASEPASPSGQDAEAQAEAGMTAKERRKAKKNKKKGKSVDLTDDAPVDNEAAHEAPVETPAGTPAEPTPGPEEEKAVEVETLKTEKPATVEPATEDMPKEENTDQPPATETAAETETVPSPAEPAQEVEMSAKERRKAKKAKKRQSKNADADNDASSAPPTEPGTPGEPADSVEKVLTSTDTLGISAVTATSPAEHDGKEHQSHDIETHAAAKEMASTDEFMSSQVEQPQIESPFLDYPPQHVLERSVNSGELEEVLAPEQDDETPATQEPELLTKEKDLEGEGQKEHGEKPQEELIEPAPNAEEMSSVPEAGDVSGEKTIEETPVGEPEEVAPEAKMVEAPVEEEAPETALSKKQKKKNKKKNKKQEEDIVEEEAPAPELETAIAEVKEMPEAVTLAEPEPEPVAETEAVSASEEQPIDQPKDIDELSAVQPIEAVEATNEPTVLEAEPVASASEEPESAPVTKLSKKDKKKQRQLLLAQEAEAKQQPEAQPAPEATEAAVPKSEVTTDATTADEKPQEGPVADAKETTVQPTDVTDETAKEIEPSAGEAEEPVPTQEPESGERSIELPSDDLKTEEIVEEPATETPAENLNAEQSTEQALAEPAIEPEPEAPTSSKKLSKKEKKKAAAAAAATAALLEEESSAKELPAAEEPSTSVPQAPEEPEQPTVDQPQSTEAHDEPQPEPEKSLDEAQELAASDPKDDEPAEQQAVEAPEHTEPLGPEVSLEQPMEELIDEPIVAEPISRKMSKKEKKKAKKQEQQELIEPTSPAEESVPAPEPETTEAVPEESTKEICVPEPETHAQETSQEAPVEPEPESTALEDNQPLESEKDHEFVSQDPSNEYGPAEAVTQEQTTFGEPTAAEEPIEKNVVEDIEVAGPPTQELEKAAGPEDQPVKSEVTPALSKKMSKKDKRKAKKKGVAEDVSEEPQANVAEEPKEIDSQPAEPVFEPEASRETDTAVEPTPVAERELLIDAPSAIEEQVQAAPANEAESETVLEPAQTEPEHVAEEETSLSRKASKKKKAKKASQGLDLEPQTEVQNETDHQAAIAPFEDDALNPRDTELADAPVEKANQEDENWPAIDWEHAKGEHAQQFQDTAPEPESEPVILPNPETIGEFEDSTTPKNLQGLTEPAEEDAWSAPLSKKDKKKAKKNKKQSQQADLEELEALPEISYDKGIEKTAPENLQGPTETTKEIEPPVRTTTPGGSKIANLFPGLERGGFKRPTPEKQTPSLKDSAEEETTAGASRDIAIPVLEAPRPTTEATEVAKDTSGELPSSLQRQIESAISHDNALAEVTTATEEQSRELDFPVHSEKSLGAPFSLPEPSKEPSSPTKTLVSQVAAGEDLSGLRRSPSIHGRHEKTPRTWSLDEPSVPALAPSPPRSLFGPDDVYARPRTPLDTIAEQEPRDGHGATTGRRGTPRLEIKPEHVLPRPQTPVRKFTGTAFDRESWPTPENESRKGSREDLKREITKTPEQVLKTSTSSGKLRRTNRSTSGDLRAASLAGSQPSDLDQLPSSSSYDPVTDKGKRPVRNMSDVYEGWGETPSSPRSPSRPPSVRRRRSMQHLQDIETRLDQLISENRLLIAARDEAEYNLKHSSVARRKSDRALNTRDGDLRDKEAEVEQLKSSVEWLQKETTRLTQENEGLAASNAALAAAHAADVNTVRESSTRELDDLRSQYTQLSSQVDDRVRQEIETALAQKDIELRRLRTELEETRDKVKELQQQIAASVHDNALVFRDEEYFDAACQKLCGHVQSWVLRFSKHNDKRRCRLLSELHDEKIADRFDNALLDGSDPDAYLSDRVRRRDVFMSVIMTMVWEYVFTRYLFGMDREQRQKLKSLEKQLGEVGPSRAVHRWRATTLTLLSRRPAFAAQRESDTEAVTLEIFKTLSKVLPPPSHVESQLLDSLRKIMRVAVNLSLEMRTQLAEFIMLPPLQPEYDTNGDLARQVYFNAALMNERSGLTNDNGELEAQQSVVRIVLFPLVVKKGNDVGEGDDEVVVCPAQVLIARPGKDKRVSRMMSGDRMSIDAAKSVHSMAPSSMMDMSNMI